MCPKGMISRKKVPAAAGIQTNNFCLQVKCSTSLLRANGSTHELAVTNLEQADDECFVLGT